MEKIRCGWVKLNDPIYVSYHDQEWGRAIHDERALFKLFSLETQSEGLSWLTILKKREAYRIAFEGFDLQKVAAYTTEDVERILQNDQIIRHKAKIESIIENAKGFLKIQDEFGSLDRYFWDKVGGKAIINDVGDHKNAITTSHV